MKQRRRLQIQMSMGGFGCVCARLCVKDNIYACMCVCACVSQTDRWTDRNSQEIWRYAGRERRWKRAGFRMKMRERQVRLTNNLMVDLLRQ